MNVILTTDIPQLGSLGDEVRVKDGYARNYLIPRQMALSAESINAKAIAHQRKLLEQKRKEAVAAAQGLANQVKSLEIVLTAKSGPNGRLFGAIHNRDLAGFLEEKGVKVDRRHVAFHAPVKNVGTHAATIKLHSDVKVEVSVKVQGQIVHEEAAPAEAVEGQEQPNLFAENEAQA